MIEKFYFKQDVWGISIKSYEAGEEFNPKVLKPTITADQVTDCKAIFVADPFLIEHDRVYYVFYEILPEYDREGVIGYSYSKNGLDWTYGKVVLESDYHLSYPYLIKDRGDIYMIPEGGAGESVKLYKAKKFPDEWEFIKDIKVGKFFDSSFFYFENKWWMLTMGVEPCANSLHLFYSDSLEGDWIAHSKNPILQQDAKLSRPGGRVFYDGSRLIRFAQDCSENYGKLLRSVEINRLSTTEYEEKVLGTVVENSSVLGSWNQDGMHHLDILKTKDDKYLVATDGYYYKSVNKLSNRLYRFIKRYPS